MAAKNYNTNYGWYKSLQANGRYPIIADRIFSTLADASSFLNSTTVIPGLILKVTDDVESLNGAYFIDGSANFGTTIDTSTTVESVSNLSLKKLAYLTNVPDVTVSITGTGNAIATMSASGHTINATLGSFSLSDHSHGNITSTGSISASVSIANGDRLIIRDADNGKIVSTSISFDGTSTNSFLSKKGTWETISITGNYSPIDSSISDWGSIGY